MLFGEKNLNKLFVLATAIVIRSDNLKTKRFYLRTAVHIFLVAAVCKKSVSFTARLEMESFLNCNEVFTEFEKQTYALSNCRKNKITVENLEEKTD